jgi:DNA-binding transcriptional regulator YiaG
LYDDWTVKATEIVDRWRKKIYPKLMLAPEQSRAARAWLNWSQEHLAKMAGVGASTVRDFEKGRHAPIQNNERAMRRALETHGIRLLFDDNETAVGIAFIRPPHSLGRAGPEKAESGKNHGTGDRE